MPFEVLPAIDVARRSLVSVSGGEIRAIDAFGGSPRAAALAFVRAGARWLHVVDVDRSNGGPPDHEVLRTLCDLGASVEAGGGIASLAAAEDALDAGASRVVLSSAVLSDTDLVAELTAALGARAVFGIEADGHVIRPRGSDGVELPLEATLDRIHALGAARYLYTSLSRVSTLGGPDLDGVRSAATILGGPLLVAGGIRTLDDVRELRLLGPDVVEGCVIGRALYEGLDLRDVLATR